jgi:hypothetical protein
MSNRLLRRPALVAVLCLAATAAVAQPSDDPALEGAARAALAGDPAAALKQLRALFEEGYAHPSRVLADPRFSSLREDHDGRGALRDLLAEFVRESTIVMVTPDEPGRPMVIRGRLVRMPDGEGVAGASIHLYHTDATGHYEPGRPAGDGSNPRLFGAVRTDADGRFEVRTIQATSYPGSRPGGAHVHYRVEFDGSAGVVRELRPYTFPRDADERSAALKRGRPVSVVEKDGEGMLVADVTLPMR